jgi:hypothetical protein
MTKYEQVKEQFSGIAGGIDLYVDGTLFYYIDVDDDRLEGYRIKSLSCGCCSEAVHSNDIDLKYELEYMDDDDFQILVEQLTYLTRMRMVGLLN